MTSINLIDATVSFGLLLIFTCGWIYFKDWLWALLSASLCVLQIDRFLVVPDWWWMVNALGWCVLLVSVVMFIHRQRQQKRPGKREQ